MCKLSLRSMEHILNRSTANFNRISISIKIPLVGRAHKMCCCLHYSDITPWCLKLSVTRLYVQQLVQAKTKENIIALHRPFVKGIHRLPHTGLVHCMDSPCKESVMRKGFRFHDVVRNVFFTLPWRHNERDGVSNHQSRNCLLNRYSGVGQGKHQSSASLAFVWGIHRSPVNSSHKGPVTQKMFPFDDVIMICFHSNHLPTWRCYDTETPTHFVWGIHEGTAIRGFGAPMMEAWTNCWTNSKFASALNRSETHWTSM